MTIAFHRYRQVTMQKFDAFLLLLRKMLLAILHPRWMRLLTQSLHGVAWPQSWDRRHQVRYGSARSEHLSRIYGKAMINLLRRLRFWMTFYHCHNMRMKTTTKTWTTNYNPSTMWMQQITVASRLAMTTSVISMSIKSSLTFQRLRPSPRRGKFKTPHWLGASLGQYLDHPHHRLSLERVPRRNVSTYGRGAMETSVIRLKSVMT